MAGETGCRRAALLLCFFLGLAWPVCGQEFARGDDDAPVLLEAEELIFDRPTETYQARGAVRLQRGDLTLLSDELSWNAASGEAAASGNVRLHDPEGTVSGEQLQVNVETGQGFLNQGQIFLRERNFHVAGERIEKFGEHSYRIHRGTFTTCDSDPPPWKFTARRLDVTLGAYAQARHAVFYLRDIPVFYFPYLIYPVKTERESGFLMPRFGYSSRRGTQFSVAYYQVLARHLDATIQLDYLSALGLGKGLEYRYILGNGETEGVLQGYHVSGFEDEGDRYAIDWKHSGDLPAGARFTADIEYVSRHDYFTDFGTMSGEYNRDQTESVLAVQRNWGPYSLIGQMRYTQDLQVPDNDSTLQRLPEISFASTRQRFGKSPFYHRFDSTYTHFWRQEGETGQRLTARPALSAVFQPGEIVEIVPVVGFRQRFYWTDAGDEGQGIYDFSNRVATRFSRAFRPQGERIRSIQHNIEPEILYSYIPSRDQTALPQFDALDRIEPLNQVTYSLTNRFIARVEPPGEPSFVHEFLYLRLSQDHFFRQPEGSDDSFSDLRADLRLRPTRASFLNIDAEYDLSAREGGFFDNFRIFSALGGVHDQAGNGLSLNYRYDQRENIEYLATGIDLAALRPVYLNYQHRQDLFGHRTLEQVVNLEYRSQCWSLFLTWRDRLDDTEYLLTFALTGIGRVARLGGSLGEQN
jgi:LPS-assembly protein